MTLHMMCCDVEILVSNDVAHFDPTKMAAVSTIARRTLRLLNPIRGPPEIQIEFSHSDEYEFAQLLGQC